MIIDQVSRRATLISMATLAIAQGTLRDANGQPAAGITPEPNADDASVQGDGGEIRIVINQTGTQCFPTMMVQKFGLDRKHGFELQIMTSANTQAEVIAIQSGNVDFGIWNWPDVARMWQAGTKVVAIAPSLKWVNTLVVPADSPAKTLIDLKGKRIGVLRRSGLDWIVVRALAQKKYGFNIEAETRIQEATIPLLRGLIDQGQLDATIMYGDYTPAMVATGKYRLLSTIGDYVNQLGIPDAPYSLVAAGMDFAARHRQNVKAFLAAYREAVDILLNDDAIWSEESKILNITEPALVPKLRDRTRPLFVKKFTSENVAAIRRTFDVLLKTAGPGPLGMTQLPGDFITLAYQ